MQNRTFMEYRFPQDADEMELEGETEALIAVCSGT